MTTYSSWKAEDAAVMMTGIPVVQTTIITTSSCASGSVTLQVRRCAVQPEGLKSGSSAEEYADISTDKGDGLTRGKKKGYSSCSCFTKGAWRAGGRVSSQKIHNQTNVVSRRCCASFPSREAREPGTPGRAPRRGCEQTHALFQWRTRPL